MDDDRKVYLRLMDDFCQAEGGVLRGTYSAYYESLNPVQAREVVSSALDKICKSDPDGLTDCEYGDTCFCLSYG